MVMIGTFLDCAYSSAGSRPSELSGEMISAWAPWSTIPLMSEISLFRSDSAFVVISLIPSFAASSLIDWVSAIRNGFASFSDWANPIVAVFRSSFGTPAAVVLVEGARRTGVCRLHDLLTAARRGRCGSRARACCGDDKDRRQACPLRQNGDGNAHEPSSSTDARMGELETVRPSTQPIHAGFTASSPVTVASLSMGQQDLFRIGLRYSSNRACNVRVLHIRLPDIWTASTGSWLERASTWTARRAKATQP